VKDATIYKELVVIRSALKLAKRRGLWVGDLGAVLPQLSAKYVPRRTTITAESFDKLLGELAPGRRRARCVHHRDRGRTARDGARRAT
jgi:hypothetical protein